MENDSLQAKEEVGCKSKKLKKSQEEWQKKLAEMEEGLRILPSLLATSSHMYQEVLLQPVPATINLTSKLLYSGIELWPVTSNC